MLHAGIVYIRRKSMCIPSYVMYNNFLYYVFELLQATIVFSSVLLIVSSGSTSPVVAWRASDLRDQGIYHYLCAPIKVTKTITVANYISIQNVLLHNADTTCTCCRENHWFDSETAAVVWNATLDIHTL